MHHEVVSNGSFVHSERLLRLFWSRARVPPCEQIFWESGVRLQLSGCEWREYSTSRGRPPCQTASWTERPSCGGRWEKKETGKFKEAETAGKQVGPEQSQGRSTRLLETKTKRGRTAAMMSAMMSEAEKRWQKSDGRPHEMHFLNVQ